MPNYKTCHFLSKGKAHTHLCDTEKAEAWK